MTAETNYEWSPIEDRTNELIITSPDVDFHCRREPEFESIKHLTFEQPYQDPHIWSVRYLNPGTLHSMHSAAKIRDVCDVCGCERVGRIPYTTSSTTVGAYVMCLQRIFDARFVLRNLPIKWYVLHRISKRMADSVPSHIVIREDTALQRISLICVASYQTHRIPGTVLERMTWRGSTYIHMCTQRTGI